VPGRKGSRTGPANRISLVLRRLGGRRLNWQRAGGQATISEGARPRAGQTALHGQSALVTIPTILGARKRREIAELILSETKRAKTGKRIRFSFFPAACDSRPVWSWTVGRSAALRRPGVFQGAARWRSGQAVKGLAEPRPPRKGRTPLAVWTLRFHRDRRRTNQRGQGPGAAGSDPRDPRPWWRASFIAKKSGSHRRRENRAP